MFKCFKMDKIQYKFNNDQIGTTKLFYDLKKYGPFDLNERDFNEIRIIELWPKGMPKNKIEKFENSLKISFETLFRLESIKIEREYYEEQHIMAAISGIISNEERSKGSNNTTKKIILHYHSYFNERYGADYYKIKKEFLGRGIPTQGLLRENFNHFNSSYVNNICAGIYAKLGGRPWVIKDQISNKLNGPTIYIGFDVSRRKIGKYEHPSPGCIVVYDEEGQYVYHFTENIPIGYEFMDKDTSKDLLVRILHNTKSIKGQFPRNVIFMRDGRINSSELMGLNDAIKNVDPSIKLFVFEFNKRSNLHIFKYNNKKDRISADTGQCIYINYSGDLERTVDLFIQTLGNDFKLPNLTRAIKVTPITKEELTEELIKDFSRQILALSNLHWSYLRGRVKLPIPVHFAHAAANLLEKGISAKNIDSMKLWML